VTKQKAIVGLALCALLALGLWPAFHSPASPMDEGMVLAYPEMLLKGHLPYRDFELITGPANPLILATAYASFGTNIFVERAVGLTYRLLIALAIFGIAQRWGTLIATASAAVAVILLGGSDLWSNTWYTGLSFALCSLSMMANFRSSWRCFAAGIFAGIALIGRCDFGPALIVALLPLFLSMEAKAKANFIAGGVLGLAPLIWMTIVIGPAPIIHNLFLFPVFQLNPGRHLPLSEAPSEMIRMLGLQIIASVINIAAGIAEMRESQTNLRGRLLLGASLLGVGLIHYALQRFDTGHAVNSSLVALSLLPLSIFVLTSKLAKASPGWAASGAAILVSLSAIHLALPTFTRYFYRGFGVTSGIMPARQPSQTGEELEPGDKAFFIMHNGRPFPFGFSYAAADADKLLTELERVSLSGQRLFVGPGDLRLTNYCDTFIYYMEPQLRPATYYLEMNPGSANAPQSHLASDVVSADWVILNRRWDYLSETNRSTQFGPSEPNLAVRENFDLWLEVGSYLLFRNKKLSNAVVPPPE
jgi:hypothetical protein